MALERTLDGGCMQRLRRFPYHCDRAEADLVRQKTVNE
jgi:hypothetical protein